VTRGLLVLSLRVGASIILTYYAKDAAKLLA
jgi:delta-aminolevulinic acid dehydratase/porphobilinogen synthase